MVDCCCVSGFSIACSFISGNSEFFIINFNLDIGKKTEKEQIDLFANNVKHKFVADNEWEFGTLLTKMLPFLFE